MVNKIKPTDHKRICKVCLIRATHRFEVGHDKYEYYCERHKP